jgi:hypothetical protein
MAYTPIPEVSNNDEITAAWWNTHIRDNFLAGIPGAYTAKGDVLAASAADAGSVIAAGSDNQVLEADSAETAGVKNSWAFVPVGGIIMWGGLIGSIPSNWQLCDGTNGTPDLRDNFVIGAGSSYAVDGTGGAASIDLEHDHKNGGVGCCDADLAGSHTHDNSGVSTGAPSRAHDHDIKTGFASASANYGTDTQSIPRQNHRHYTPTDTENAHTHALQTTGTSDPETHTHYFGTSDNQLSATQSVLPKYYALSFIMRLS